ncbi:hypothetical protein J2Z79_002356 [Symbiobacterium terraclitae]|uniref:DUF4180 domain-containing protein n=1 Tax=Symbiobacterium terraclitae TaxID=557451 RepID=A0ABS4JTT3_9FIRM|nr:hypothetical protein [Symbiobacterium terraclitae]
MAVDITRIEGTDVVLVESPEVIINTAQDALDLMATIYYNHECSKVIIDKACIAEDFFNLRTGLAGEILQKVSNYRFALAIVGDFGVYDSKALRDFIHESNRGRHVFFVPDRETALQRLSQV